MNRPPQTFADAAADFNHAIREVQRVLAKQVQPEIERLIDALNAVARHLYLARLRRWIPFLVAALTVGAVIGWWLS